MQRAIRLVDLDGERGRVERQRVPAHGVCGVEILHGQGVVAKIIRRFAQREVEPHTLGRFQSRRGQRGFHPFQQTVVIARDPAAPYQIVIASRQQRRDRDRAFEALAGLVETAELREQIAQQIMRHGVPRIVRQRPSQHLFGFLIAVLGQQRPSLAQPAEAAVASGRRRAAETADRLLTMAQRVDQGAGAEPRLGQGRKELSGAVVRHDGLADVAQLLQSDSQAEICIAVARVAGDRPLQCRDGIRYPADLEAGEAEIMMDDGIGRLQQRGFAQWRDRIGRLPRLEQIGGQRQQRCHVLRRGWSGRPGHGYIIAKAFVDPEHCDGGKIIERCVALLGFQDVALVNPAASKKRWLTMAWPSRKMRVTRMASRRNLTIPPRGVVSVPGRLLWK